MKIPDRSMEMARVHPAGADTGVAIIVDLKERIGDKEPPRRMRSAVPVSEPRQFSSMDMVLGEHIRLVGVELVDARPQRRLWLGPSEHVWSGRLRACQAQRLHPKRRRHGWEP